MAELNSGRLAILLQNWNHPVIRPFIATAAAGLAAITVYERGLSIDVDTKRLNHFIAHLAAPELGRGLYTSEKQLSPNYPATEIFGLLEPEQYCAAKIITLAPVLPSNVSGVWHTAAALPAGKQEQAAILNGGNGISGLAAPAVVAAGAIFFAYKKYKTYCNNNKEAGEQKLKDAQCIAQLMLQLDEVKASKLTDGQHIAHLKLELDEATASKLKIETAIKAAENDSLVSSKDKDQLRGEFSVSTIMNDELMRKLDKTEEGKNRNARLVDEAIKRLEAEKKRAAVLVDSCNTQVKKNSHLQDKLSKAQSAVCVLQDEKSAREREVQEQLQKVRLKKDDLANQLHYADVDKTKLKEQLATARSENGNASLQIQPVSAEKTKLEKQKTARNLPKLSMSKTGGEDDNDNELNHDITGSTYGSQQRSSQQQARLPDTSGRSSNAITAEVDGEQSPMSMTFSVPLSGELNIPRRKRREYWFGYWRFMNLGKVYPDDVVCEMELPCFDARFSRIGIVRPSEKRKDQMLESGKVPEHTKCNLCLQWYTKKDMYDHLKICKAFWELTIRCCRCTKIFKYNTAFFDGHVPDCKTQLTEENLSGDHFTLARSEVNATTTWISQQASPNSSVSVLPGKQTKPHAPTFTPKGSTPGLEKPISTGPRFLNMSFQQGRDTSFHNPQYARSPRFMPHVTPHHNLPAHGSGFGTTSPPARSPAGLETYLAPRDNSQTYGSPGHG
ncbi:hypothetical protein G6011_06451 [Alternaria panax]|uniref:Uncharacterized protein n=1 Tax=Alternaria panax TaxID=48097 RepID=A0AAD4I825_9PLEO|nr:hypothetical protein G6011_06851 [Alternaria panax]KAG9189583.1 hypothetical protein G6011_06451 [Alternaria panax]